MGVPVPHARGFALQVGGLASAAALYAGFRRAPPCTVGGALLISGATAGLAGARWSGGTHRPSRPTIPGGLWLRGHWPSWGATTRLAWCSRRCSLGMFTIGAELARSPGLPKSLTGCSRGLLLFTLLACDTLIAYPRALGGCAQEEETLMESYALLLGSAESPAPCWPFAALGLLINSGRRAS